MKKVFLLAMLATVSINSFSQSRVDEVRPEISPIIAEIGKTPLWEFSKYDGKWHKDYSSAYKKIELRSIVVDNSKYYIMSILQLEGTYKYPSIKQGFYTYDCYTSYIFNEKEFNNLNANGGEIKGYFSTSYSVSLEIDPVKLRDDILRQIKYGEKKYYEYKFSMKKEGESAYRFIVPAKYASLSEDWGFDKKYYEIDSKSFNPFLSIIGVNTLAKN